MYQGYSGIKGLWKITHKKKEQGSATPPELNVGGESYEIVSRPSMNMPKGGPQDPGSMPAVLETPGAPRDFRTHLEFSISGCGSFFGNDQFSSPGYFQLLGPVYYIRTGVLLTLSLAAIKIGNHRFHAVFAIVALICETAIIVAAHFRMELRRAWVLRARRRPVQPRHQLHPAPFHLGAKICQRQHRQRNRRQPC